MAERYRKFREMGAFFHEVLGRAGDCMKKPVWVESRSSLIFLGVIVYSTMNLSQNKVEVCMTFNGQTSARSPRRPRRISRERTAITNACGEMASGVTETMACNQLKPDSVKWLK